MVSTASVEGAALTMGAPTSSELVTMNIPPSASDARSGAFGVTADSFSS